MIRSTIHDVREMATGLDHAEGLNFGPDGTCHAGGEDGQVYRFRPGEAPVVYARTSGGIGGVCLDGDGNLYACDYGRAVVERVSPDGEVQIHSAGAPGRPALEPNYPVLDGDGFLYYSDSGSYYRPNGRLFVVTPAGETKLLFGGHLQYPNGLAIDPDGRWLFAIQSTAPNIIRFPIVGPGQVGEPETYVQLRGAVPDGLAVAASGTLYIGCYTPDLILRIPPNRAVEVVVEDPGSDVLNRPTNVAFEPGTTHLWFANFGGHTIGSIDVGEPGSLLNMPHIRNT